MRNLLLYLFSTILWQAAHAEVSLSANQQVLPKIDGSYAITQDLGVSAGNNLFHSFQTFNLEHGETASFSGAPTIENVIARVTGGEASRIDGTMQNKIPGADTWLLNPSGILFGAHAQLDVQGSFYAGAADALKFADGGEFDANKLKESAFSSAPPAAFGFLSPAGVEIDGASLAVPEGRELGLSGGGVEIRGSRALELDKTGITILQAATGLRAPGGTVALTTPADGLVHLQKSLIDTSGDSGGGIFIKGGRLVMEEAALQGNTLGNGEAQGIHLDLAESIYIRNLDSWKAVSSLGLGGGGNHGDISLSSPRIEMEQAVLATDHFSPGQGADIKVQADELALKNGVVIGNGAYAKGSRGGDNLIEVQRLTMEGRADRTYLLNGLIFKDYVCDISAAAFAGDGGNTRIHAEEIILDRGIISAAVTTGNAGTITLRAGRMDILNGGGLSVAALYPGGKAGQIDVEVSGELNIQGKRQEPYTAPYPAAFPETAQEFTLGRSGITGYSPPGSRGGGAINIKAGSLRLDDNAIIKASTLENVPNEDRGHIRIDAGTLEITGGAQITNSNRHESGIVAVGQGDAGDIDIRAERIDIAGSGAVNGPSGIYSDTYSGGHGGNINLHSDSLNIRDGGAISSHSDADGNAGNVHIQTRDLTLRNGGLIDSEAQAAGGGTIQIDSNGLVRLDKAAISTSVHSGAGGGGDVTIKNPAALVLWGDAKIIAQAHEGRGGNIQIRTDNLLQTPDSLISASSQLGLDGEVRISSSLELGNQLVPYFQGFLADAEIGGTLCATRAKRSHLVWRNPDGRPMAAEDFQD